jgi:hypothetical protein
MGKTVGNLDKSVKTSLDNDFAAKNHTHSPADIGAATSNHSHTTLGSFKFDYASIEMMNPAVFL